MPLDDVWPRDLVADGVPQPAQMHADGSAVLAYCPSSGTTGARAEIRADEPRPHGAAHRGPRHSAPLFGGPRQTCLVGPTSIFGLGRMLRTLWCGNVVVEPNLDAQELASWLASSRVNHIAISPIGLQKILEVLPADGVACAVETIEVGGGILPRSTFDVAQRRLPGALIATYGATETGPVAAAPMGAIIDRPGAVGFLFPGVAVEIVDADDRPVAAGEEGILRVRSSHAASAYVGNDAAASRVFRDGWVYPNDRAILDRDGLLRLMGRTDDVIVAGGAKVNPQAIEDVLFTLADLREAAVFGAPDDSGMVVLCAAIVPNAPLLADEFHARCRKRLGAQAPVFIMHLRELPRNAMGKVQRNELARMAVDASRGPRGPLSRGPLH